MPDGNGVPRVDWNAGLGADASAGENCQKSHFQLDCMKLTPTSLLRMLGDMTHLDKHPCKHQKTSRWECGRWGEYLLG